FDRPAARNRSVRCGSRRESHRYCRGRPRICAHGMPMKGIQADCRRSLSCLAAALFLGCGSAGEREIVHADGEIFEAIVRSQVSDSAKLEARTTSALRFDSRPAGDNTDLAMTPE